MINSDILVSSIIISKKTAIISFGNLYPLFLVIYVFYFLLSIIFLLSSFKTAKTYLEKTQLSYLLIGTFIAGGFGQIVNVIFPIFSLPYYPAENIAKLIWIGFCIYAVTRKKPLDVEVFLSKTLVYYTLTIISIGIYLLGIKSLAGYFGKIIGQTQVLIESLMIVGFGFIFKPLLDNLEKFIDKKLFPKIIDFQNVLSDFSKSLIFTTDVSQLSKLIVNTISDNINMQKLFLLFFDRESQEFRIENFKGLEKHEISIFSIGVSHPFVQFLKTNNKLIIVENIPLIYIEKFKDIFNKLIDLKIAFVAPLVSHNKIIGILGGGEKTAGTSISSEEIEMLEILVNQASIALENAYMYEDLKKTYQKYHKKEHLLALGEMSSKLAHEIKNPLSNIKGSAQLIKKEFEFSQEDKKFIDFIIDETDRLNRLVVDFLSFAKIKNTNIKCYNLLNIIDDVLEQINFSDNNQNIKIEKFYDEKEYHIWTDADLIKQVFLNIFQNSLYAMKDTDGVLSLYVKRDAHHSKILIEVIDTGCGITSENLSKVFDPFFTTKEEGIGLGLSVVHKIITELGGEISIESPIFIIDNKEQGTKVKIKLPLTKID